MLNKLEILNLRELLERAIKEQPTLTVAELESGAILLTGIQRLIENKEYYMSKKVIKNYAK